MLPDLEKFLIGDWKWRVCLRPKAWNKLWELLPERKRVGNGWEPPLPLILAAWHETTDQQKRDRFIEHLAWAEAHGASKVVLEYLQSLQEDDWLHMRDPLESEGF